MDINLIKPDTDLSKIYKFNFNWDVSTNNAEFDTYSVPGHYHTIGGKFGNNDIWVCPKGEEPSCKNLIGFNGFAVRWSFKIEETNYIKHKYDESSLEGTVICTIFRNDEEFYSFRSKDIPYACATAQVLITELNEHPIPFAQRDYENEIIGRKILYHDEPAIITSYFKSQASVIIEFTDKADIKRLTKICCIDYDYRNNKSIPFVKDEIFSKHIWWFDMNYYKCI